MFLGKLRHRPLLGLRGASRLAFFALFIVLLLRTEYRGSPEIGYPVNLFFQADPFLAFSTWLAARDLPRLFWPAFLTVAGTLLLGRVFCGWVCPLGTLLDFTGRPLRRGRFPVAPALGKMRHLKYYLLAGTIAAALLGMQAGWILDPFSILGRGFAVSVIPAANLFLNSVFDLVFRHWRPLSDLIDPFYRVMQENVLTFDQQFFRWGTASLLALGLVLAGEALRPRLWCRHLCPLGALLSLLSRVSLLGRRVSERCNDCGACWDRCPQGLVRQGNHRARSPECSACLDCREICPRHAIGFRFNPPAASPEVPLLSRRWFLGSVLGGVAAVPLLRTTGLAKVPAPGVVRPPGALPERAFLRRCVRCGSCMKVCMGNAIHPALHEAGMEGIMTPMMDFRIGYCEYNCTLCGQVCPTAAIRRLPVEEKRLLKIGEAVIDQGRCLPWAQGINCIVCEEHCPVSTKAIRFEEGLVRLPAGGMAWVKKPRVVAELCIGCGVCETKCPLRGRSAIVIGPQGEGRAGG